ncbi:hypothetical protein Tco_0212173 [Tanacetum coccineum]
MLLCKQEEAGVQLNAKQANWRDDTDDEPDDQELEAHYISESSNNHFKEANNELSKTNQLMLKDLKKFQAELDRIECARATPTANLPFGMFLTRLYRHVMETHVIPSLLILHLNRLSISSNVDDDDDVKTSRASTPSPTTYLNSLHQLNYQNNHMPSSSEQTDETLFERQTTLLNQTQQMHKEMRGGFKSFGKALKGVFSKKKK